MALSTRENAKDGNNMESREKNLSEMMNDSLDKKISAFLRRSTTKDLATKKLLQLTANPNEENLEIAKEMLKNDFSLMLYKTPFTEELCGKREWKKPISPLEYTAFSGDSFLRKEYLKYLPTDRDIKLIAGRELYSALTNGTEHGRLMAPFYELICLYTKIKTEFDYNDMLGSNTGWTLRGDYFAFEDLRKLGEAQFNSCVHLLQWFFSTIPFSPTPSFDHAPERPTMPRAFSDSDLACNTGLVGVFKELSYEHNDHFALYKGKGKSFPEDTGARMGIFCGDLVRGKWNRGNALEIDSAAIKQLCEVSMKYLIEDIKTLAPDLIKSKENSKSTNHDITKTVEEEKSSSTDRRVASADVSQTPASTETQKSSSEKNIEDKANSIAKNAYSFQNENDRKKQHAINVTVQSTVSAGIP